MKVSLTILSAKKVFFDVSFIGKLNIGKLGHSQLAAIFVDYNYFWPCRAHHVCDDITSYAQEVLAPPLLCIEHPRAEVPIDTCFKNKMAWLNKLVGLGAGLALTGAVVNSTLYNGA